MTCAQYDVAVIGGGAAGMMAAIRSAECGSSVIVLEKNDICGKKLLATGNGRCNYTNARQERACYHGASPDFACQVIGLFGCDQTVEYFRRLGIEPYVRSGYYYPASGQALSVRDVLLMRMRYLGVHLQMNCAVRGIERTVSGSFIIPWLSHGKKACAGGRIECRSVILTTGGMSAPSTGSTGDGYYWVGQLGIRCLECVPALVGIHAGDERLKALSGIRCPGTATAWIEGRPASQDTGEIQYNRDGVSGIPVMNISRDISYALKQGKDAQIRIRLLPGTEDIRSLLKRRFHSYPDDKTAREAMCGLLPERMNGVLLYESRIDPARPAASISGYLLDELTSRMDSWVFHVTSTCGFDRAQTTAGGICADEIDPATMSLIKVPGLYAAGEIVDIDGICGGYNLQWAWSSGTVAGRAAAAYTLS